MRAKEKKHLSFGSFLMIFISILVVAGFAYVFPKLTGGQRIDITRLDLDDVLDIHTQAPMIESLSVPNEQNITPDPPVPQATSTIEPEDDVPEQKTGGSVTMTFGGIIALEDAIRKSAYLSDTRQYDFSEVLRLISPYMDSDINCAFFENLLLDNQKVSNLVVPSNAAEALKMAGFNHVCLGFPKVYDKDSDGLGATMTSLREYGMEVHGVNDEQEEDRTSAIQEAGNLKVAILQYTSDISSNGTKLMKKRGEQWAVPADDPDQIGEDIASVRSAGADVVVVCLHWGKIGNKAPNKKQKELAQKIAELGADIIIGAGSRVVQNIEYLTVERQDGTKGAVLCAWSVGCLMCESRDAGRVAGLLLKLSISKDADQHVSVQTVEYIPTYIWQYKQDGLTYYRTIAADRNKPDGLTSNDEKNMDKAVTNVSKTLADSPVLLK